MEIRREEILGEGFTVPSVTILPEDAVGAAVIVHGLMYKFTRGFIKKELEKQGIDTSKRYDYRDWDAIRT